MLGKKDCRQKDRWTDTETRLLCLSDCLCVHTNFTKHPSLPNPTTTIGFSWIPSHCTAFTHDVYTNAPKKPQPPPPPTVCSLYHLQSPHQSSLTQVIEPKKETKPKERRQSAAPAH